MGEEFSFFQKLEDSYSVEDILDICEVSVEDLLKYYLRDVVLRHKQDFDLEEDYVDEQ